MEAEILKGIHWKLTSTDVAVSKQKLTTLTPAVPPKTLTIKSRYES